MVRIRTVAGPALVSLVLLAALEGGLRLFGFEVTISGGWDPALNLFPLFRPDVGADGSPIMKRFNYPVSFRRTKPPNGLRVFVVGESSTVGFPFGPELSFTRFLQERLEASFPDRAVEVLNCAAIGIGSWHSRQIVNEIAHYQPDVVVINIGHNDWVIQDPGAADSLLRALSRSRLYQLAVLSGSAWRRWRYGPIDEHQLLNPRDPWGLVRLRAHGGALLTAGDRERIGHRLADNLRAMVAGAQAAGATVVLASISQNLKDFQPGASIHRHGLSAEQRERWRSAVEEAERLRRAGDCQDALTQLAAALRIDRRPALVQYARGQCLEALGRFGAARAAYRAASDLDAIPLGAPSSLRDLVRQVAIDTGAQFVDVVGALELRSPHGLVGSEFFFDHLHPTLVGHFEIARVLATALGANDTAYRGPDHAALLVMQRQVGRPLHVANLVLYVTLGRYDLAADELQKGAREYPELLRMQHVVDDLSTKDPPRAWTDLPESPD